MVVLFKIAISRWWVEFPRKIFFISLPFWFFVVKLNIEINLSRVLVCVCLSLSLSLCACYRGNCFRFAVLLLTNLAQSKTSPLLRRLTHFRVALGTILFARQTHNRLVWWSGRCPGRPFCVGVYASKGEGKLIFVKQQWHTSMTVCWGPDPRGCVACIQHGVECGGVEENNAGCIDGRVCVYVWFPIIVYRVWWTTSD